MPVKDESLQRMREAGRRSATQGAAEMAAYEQGRTDLWECVANSSHRTTKKAVAECRLALEK